MSMADGHDKEASAILLMFDLGLNSKYEKKEMGNIDNLRKWGQELHWQPGPLSLISPFCFPIRKHLVLPPILRHIMRYTGYN